MGCSSPTGPVPLRREDRPGLRGAPGDGAGGVDAVELDQRRELVSRWLRPGACVLRARLRAMGQARSPRGRAGQRRPAYLIGQQGYGEITRAYSSRAQVEGRGVHLAVLSRTAGCRTRQHAGDPGRGARGGSPPPALKPRRLGFTRLLRLVGIRSWKGLAQGLSMAEAGELSFLVTRRDRGQDRLRTAWKDRNGIVRDLLNAGQYIELTTKEPHDHDWAWSLDLGRGEARLPRRGRCTSASEGARVLWRAGEDATAPSARGAAGRRGARSHRASTAAVALPRPRLRALPRSASAGRPR